MKSKFFLGLIMLAAATSCKKADTDNIAPTAGFTIQNPHAELNEGAVLKLTNTSSSSRDAAYLWDFGNGKTSTEKEPTIEYAMHGNYNVKLTVTDSKGRISTTTQTVTVLCIFATLSHPPLF